MEYLCVIYIEVKQYAVVSQSFPVPFMIKDGEVIFHADERHRTVSKLLWKKFNHSKIIKRLFNIQIGAFSGEYCAYLDEAKSNVLDLGFFRSAIFLTSAISIAGVAFFTLIFLMKKSSSSG